jgi:hypothetical protein
MLALIGYGLLGIVVAVGVVALLVLVLPGDHLGAAPRDVVPAGLPARPEIGGNDVARVRLPVTLRGYRMVDTDAVLDRLALELERRDHEIDDLRRSAGLPARSTEAPPFAEAPQFAAAGRFAEDAAGHGASAGEEVLAAPGLDMDDNSRPYACSDDAPSHPVDGDPQPQAVDGGTAR